MCFSDLDDRPAHRTLELLEKGDLAVKERVGGNDLGSGSFAGGAEETDVDGVGESLAAADLVMPPVGFLVVPKLAQVSTDLPARIRTHL